MRRIFASILVVLMLVTSVQPCFAAPPEGKDYYGMARMDLSVFAKTSTGDYTDSLNLEGISSSTKVDYKINLDMQDVRTVLQRAADKDDAKEVRNGTLTMNLKVTAKFPKAAVINEENLKNYNSSEIYNGIFVETNRVIGVGDDSRTVESTFVLNKSITLEELIVNSETYLKDISFELKDGISYATAGEHKVEVSAAGEVELTFTYGHKEQVWLETENPVIYTINTTVSTDACILVVEDAVAPTCDTPGKTVAVRCANKDHAGDGDEYNCFGAKAGEPIDPTGHEYATVEEIPATCTTAGVKKHINCKNCKSKFVYDAENTHGAPTTLEELAIAAKGHQDPPTFVDAEPKTSTKDGHEAGTICSVCGVVLSGMEIIPAGHTKSVTKMAKAATCTEAGWTEAAECSYCQEILAVSMPIAALGHKFSEWVPVEGEEQKTRKCSVCGKVETVSTHVCSVDETKTVTVNATCSARGSVTKYCSCGSFISTEVIERTAHKMGSLVPGRAATCSSEGVIAHYVCENQGCSLKFRDIEGKSLLSSTILPIDPKNHTLDDSGKIITDATCLKPGIKEVKKCECGYVVNEIIPQIIHKSDDEHIEYIKVDAKCETTGIEAHYHCDVTGKDFATELNAAGELIYDITGKDFTIPAKGHNWEIQSDNETIKCSVCQADKKIVANCGEGNHQFRRTTVNEATCTVPGSFKDFCLLCGESKTGVIPAAHTYGYWIDAVPSTCTVKGTIGHYHCLKCNGYFDANKNVITELTTDCIPHAIQNGKCKDCDYKIVVSNHAGDKIKDVGNTNNAKPQDSDKKLEEHEEKFREAIKDIGVTINYILEDRYEVSEQIENDIQNIIKNKNIDSIDGIGKIAFEAVVEKVIEYKDGDENKKDITEIDETEQFVEIKVDISSLKHMLDFKVHRRHFDKVENRYKVEYIEETPHEITGEYIKIDTENWILTMYVKKFSEYAVVGYAESVGQLNPPSSGSVSGGGGSSTFSIRFHANGGTVVETVKAKKGAVIAEPTTTRDGYIFAGWYTDSEFTKPFDFSTPIKSSLNLYAKWIEDGTGVSDNICNEFSDISVSAWYHQGVHYALENGIMNGTGGAKFAPDLNVTRAMLVTVLWRAEDRPISTVECAFADLKAGEYYVDAVKWADENGVVTGVTSTEFAPNDAITREQFATIMYRYAKLKGYDVSVGENTNILSYADYSKISEYAIPAMQYAAGSGLMTGRTASTLNPQDQATRAEMATILFRFFEANK